MTSVSVSEILMLDAKQVSYETGTAKMYFHIPWIGPGAYLHTVFKPANEAQLEQASQELCISPWWKDFLRVQNGANLFLNSLYIFGVVHPSMLRVRTVEARIPFDIEEQNREASLSSLGNWLQIGAYGYSGTRILLDRTTNMVQAEHPTGKCSPMRWAHPESWIRSELKRLSLLFSQDGRLLTDERLTEPWDAGGIPS